MICVPDLPASSIMALDHVLAALWTRSCDLSAAGQHMDIVVWSLELMGYVRSLSEADTVCLHRINGECFSHHDVFVHRKFLVRP